MSWRFVLNRVAGLVVVLWALVTIVFLLGSVIPSDPARVYAGAGASQEVIDEKREELELDEPLATRYVHYLDRLVHGDLSESTHSHRPVVDDLADALPATLELLGVAIVMVAVIGLLVGTFTATARRGSGVVRGVLLAGASVPTFTLGLLALFLLYYKLGWFPSGGRSSEVPAPVDGPTGFLLADSLFAGQLNTFFDSLWHLVLPAITLALTPALLTARTLRSALRQSMDTDYARTARAKGLTERRVLWRHALRNSVNAPLTIFGLELGAMLAGIAIVETIFSWPGLGLYIERAIAATDVPAITGVTLVIGAVFVIANAIADAIQVAVDPRMRKLG
ncbi:MAG: ABC transporter permease [Solirubrobacterales bacterium]|nr:ABC transporter permease [Solirubrobacterales bacterium]